VYTYLVVDAIFLLVWSILFLHRKDLRYKIILSSLVILPLGIFDYLSQPSYWHPPTFFSIPVGLEGVLLGFSLGGIGAVLYDEISKQHLRKLKRKKPSLLAHFIVPLAVAGTSFLLHVAFHINMMISLPIGLTIGFILILLIRPDLKKPILFSGIYFGILYYLILFCWLYFFPEARNWWNLEIYSGLAVFGVPLGEALFGFLFGAFWGPIYEFLFDYKLV
jgi:hypothetical protein